MATGRQYGARTRARAMVFALGCAAAASPLVAQLPEPPPESVWVTPGSRYAAGYLHRLLLSRGHREVWSTPVHAEVLDLDRVHGGLTPGERGGGRQTLSIRLHGADGVEYVFRLLDKDASRVLDPALRESIAADVLQDQVASILPFGALVVAPLLDAVDVLHADPALYVMPDDPRLGEHREVFAGKLGLLEVRPNEGDDDGAGFAGSNRVTGSERFLERIEASPANRPDVRAYLRARLLDFLVGDWDRHPDQWRWAAFPVAMGDTLWQPVPRDRDWALNRMDGVLVKAAAHAFPHYTGFGRDYASAFRLSWSGRALDRLILAATPRETFDDVALDLASRLTDDVIDDAVRRLPAPYYAGTGRELRTALRSRRDRLTQIAREFYLLLAGWIDLEATDEDDVALVERTSDGTVRVSLRLARGDRAYAERTLRPRETHELRLDLHGGRDSAIVRGPRAHGITIRIMGGGSDDTLIDETGTGDGVHFYDHRGDNTFMRAGGTHVDRSNYEEPPRTADNHMARARDWGAYWLPVPAFEFDPDVGLFVGARAVRTGYGFRHHPYRDRFGVSVGIGTNSGRLRVTTAYEFPVMGALRGEVHARWSGAEVDRFYGFGNETTDERPRDEYHAQRSEMRLELLGAIEPVPDVDFEAGLVAQRIRHYENEGTVVDALAPYGYGNWDQAGIIARTRWDTRNHPVAPSRGASVGFEGFWIPDMLDVERRFASVSGDAAVHVTAPIVATPTLSLRAGGEKRFGTYPYHAAAYIGGTGTVRGFTTRRFAGDAALFGNAELRLTVADTYLLLPGNIGVFGLADTGRVYLGGEDSDVWHSGLGGGIWISFLDPANALSLAVARSDERTGLYVKAGFGF